ncbi:hypothetical protein C7972_12042 [Arenibacter sp. ARW7G5Y1]|nr:hypothetical protein C7972_12042 [Arenibacter sp. ARW7G5Y1]
MTALNFAPPFTKNQYGKNLLGLLYEELRFGFWAKPLKSLLTDIPGPHKKRLPKWTTISGMA